MIFIEEEFSMVKFQKKMMKIILYQIQFFIFTFGNPGAYFSTSKLVLKISVEDTGSKLLLIYQGVYICLKRHDYNLLAIINIIFLTDYFVFLMACIFMIYWL